MSKLEEKRRWERCMIWQFKQLLEQQVGNASACEAIQRILAKHESLLSHYQQWSIVEAAEQ